MGGVRQARLRVQDTLFNNRLVQALSAKKWSLLLVVMGFLLGRATILEQLTPFALAYFAVLFFIRKDLTKWIGISVFAGSAFSSLHSSGYIAAEIFIFLMIHKGLEAYERSEVSYAPVTVFLASFMTQLFAALIDPGLSWYLLMIASVEAALSFILTVIFFQALPVFTLTRKNYQLRNEEIICLMIMLASVMTGTVGWSIGGDISIEHVMSRYFILVFALVGGAPLGASVGVVTGLILSLADSYAVAQMSLLAFSGMLAGLLREGRKMAVAFGMLVGSSILSVYIGSTSDVMLSTWESVAAVVLFLLTPKSVIQTIAKYVPGTQENLKSQHDYAKRVRDATAGRVEQFSAVFKQLSRSFSQLSGQEEERKELEIGHFMNSVVARTCETCHMKKKCWDDKFYSTYKWMTDMMSEIEGTPDVTVSSMPKDWKGSCVKSDKVLSVMKQQYELYKHDQHWKKQLQDSRHLVAEQLFGVSQVMEDLAKEIKREGQEMYMQEEHIRQSLEDLGLSIYSIDIISLEEGNVEIEMIHQFNSGLDESRKMIAPMLSDILNENIAVKKEVVVGKGGYTSVTFGSAKEYEIETGIAGAAKGGDLLSGDSFSTVELSTGKFALALSDGMGNGERASYESKTALNILEQMLQSGVDEKLATKTVNSVLTLRSSDEVFATIDLALIDLYSAQTTFMKIGSTPSFIRRNGEVLVVSANNLPVGILKDIDIDLVNMQLLPGDILIMITDGIYDAPGHAVNKELWLKRIISEIAAEDPQDIADCLLEMAVRYHQGEIRDDMTVLVAKVDKYKPEWATFRWPGAQRLERPKTVS